MGTACLMRATYRHTCDRCKRVVDSGAQQPPPLWTVVAFPARGEEIATVFRTDSDAMPHRMVQFLLCWVCLDDIGAVVRTLLVE